MAFLAAVKARGSGRDQPTSCRIIGGQDHEPDPEQVGAALLEAPDHFHAFVAVCAFARLRLGEGAGLQLGDLDFLRRTMSIQRQIQGQVNSKTVEVSPKLRIGPDALPLPDDLVRGARRSPREASADGEERWLFSLNGYIYNRNSAGNQWRSLRARAGMEAFTLHDLKQYFASGLIADGCDVVTVQQALGHSSASITLSGYSHLCPKAEDWTRAATTNLMAITTVPADSVRTRAGS
jgi:integrase